VIVVEADGNDDGGKSLAAGHKAGAYLVFESVELAQRNECVDARADQESEEPAEGDKEEGADFASVLLWWEAAVEGCGGVVFLLEGNAHS
jgi:hypothetical protein